MLRQWILLRCIGVVLWIIPLLLIGIAPLLERKGLVPAVREYEEGAARAVQYALFTIGVAIFLFADGISNFLRARILAQKQGATVDQMMAGYHIYTIAMMGVLDGITLTGFAGFFICGNMTWLTLFVVLSFCLHWRYFPSPARLQRLLEKPQRH